jgi:hypothetical protein
MAHCCTGNHFCDLHARVRLLEQAGGRATLRRSVTEAKDSEALKQRIVAVVRRLPGAWQWYFTTDSRRSPTGFPDLVLLRPPQPSLPGRHLVVECKREVTDYPRADQQRWLETFWALGVEVYVWYPSDEPGLLATLQAQAVSPRCTTWRTRCRFPVHVPA